MTNKPDVMEPLDLMSMLLAIEQCERRAAEKELADQRRNMLMAGLQAKYGLADGDQVATDGKIVRRAIIKGDVPVQVTNPGSILESA